MDRFVEIRGTIPEADEERLAGSLSDLPVLGVQINPEMSGRVDVRVWANNGDEVLVEEIQRLLSELGSATVERADHGARDWSARWRESLAPFEVGRRWWIDPHPGSNHAPPDGRLRLSVVPRAAFGSGTHESTQLVLMQLEEIDCAGSSVLDVGTGSGVLAVAADRMGAGWVLGLDIDPIAAWEATRTAAAQSWVCRPSMLAGPMSCLGGAVFDLVLCNMIVTEFGPILPEIRRVLAPTGRVVLSGILECERQSVDDLLHDRGMVATRVIGLGEWISVLAAVESV